MSKLNRFNEADKVLCSVFVIFLALLSFRVFVLDNIIIRFLLFCAEAGLVGGIADWFAVTALFKKPLGFPFHTAILPRKRDSFVDSCIRMLQTEFLSKKKIYRRICNADLLSRGLEWLRQPKNKEYFIHIVINFIVDKIKTLDLQTIVASNRAKFADLILKESMKAVSDRLVKVLIDGQNSEMAVDKGLFMLNNYFAGEQGKRRVLSFIEAYQRQYTKNGLSGFMLSIALASNALDPEELAEIIHERIVEVLTQCSDRNGEVYGSIIDLWNNLLQGINENEDWANSLNDLRNNFVQSETLDKILYNTLKNFCDYLVANSGEGNKLHMAITYIMRDEIDACIDNLNTDTEFKSKINRFVMDVLHRSALKGEDMILALARKFLEGLSNEQLNELVYDKVEKDLIWIRLNGSIVGGFIGMIAFWILEFIK